MEFKNVVDGEFEEIKNSFKNKKEKTKFKLPKIRIKKVVIPLIFVLFIIGVFLYFINGFYIDYLWFREVGYLNIFFKELKTKVYMFIPLFLILFMFSMLYIKFLKKSFDKENIVLSRHFGKISAFISLVFSVVFSVIATSTLWYKFLEFINSVPFNKSDGLFNKDISFYVFKLPFYMALNRILIIFILTIFVITVVLFMFFKLKGIRNRNEGIIKYLWENFKLPFCIFVSILCLCLSIHFYLNIFNICYDSTGIVYGATYTDMLIDVNKYRVLSVFMIIFAVVLSVCCFKNKVKPIIICIIIIPLFIFGMTGLKFVIQNYIVVPNEYAKEEKYINNNIDMTRAAYNIADVEVKDFKADNNLTKEDVENNSVTISNIPINDFLPTLDTYNSLQSFRSYYTFKDVDVDRYNLDGDPTQVFISVREMQPSSKENVRSFVNKHQKYTHGYGSVVAPVNQINSSGQPVLIQKDIPATTIYDDLKIIEPRIYYGEMTSDYAIVNCKSDEFDYPKGDNNVENRYVGNGGIKLNLINRIAFSINNMNSRFIFSSDITSDSKVLIRREIKERVSTIAPFLEYDDDPYIVNANGRLYWIIDAFTLSDKYPCSTPSKFQDGQNFNYIRNSVKVVVDAYNGTVEFYQVDKNDPIATLYAKMYPGFIKQVEEMDPVLKEHLRYSEVLFNIQSSMYENYHMTNSQVFYNKEDQWQTAKQFYGTTKETVNVNSAYMMMKLPDSDKEEFIIMTPFTPKNKNNMVAWMAGICDGEDYGKLKVYKFPKQKLVYGPMQIEQRIDQDTDIAPKLNLLSQASSEVSRGNMLTIPIEDSILYVEPIYVKSKTDQMALPEVKKVIVAYGEKIVMEDSLSEGINAIFNLKDGKDENTKISLEDKARDLMDKIKDAQAKGDSEAYDKYMNELENILNSM